MSIRRPSFALQGVLAPELRTQNLSGADDELQRLILRVDYISSPGYPEGSKARERYGFVGGGPSAIVTTLGILQPDLQTRTPARWLVCVFQSRADPGAHRMRVWAFPCTLARCLNQALPSLPALRKVDETGMLRRG